MFYFKNIAHKAVFSPKFYMGPKYINECLRLIFLEYFQFSMYSALDSHYTPMNLFQGVIIILCINKVLETHYF